MGRIDRYILKQLIALFGFFALVLVLIYWINRAVVLFDQLIADGQSAFVFLEFTALSLPSIIALIMPIAAFAAAVYVTNRLSADSELVVVQAAGYSAFRLARPFVIFSIGVSLMLLILLHYLVPTSSLLLNQRSAEIAENVTARLLKEGTFVTPTDDITFYVREISEDGELQAVFLNDASDPDFLTTYSAGRAFLVRSDDGPKLVLIDGLIQRRNLNQNTLSAIKFNDFVLNIGSILTSTEVRQPRISELDSLTLYRLSKDLADTLNISQFNRNYQLSERTYFGILPFIAVMLGFSVLISGGFSRFGIWQHILIAIALMIAVKVVEGMVVDSVRSNRSGLWAFFLPFVAGTTIASFVLLRYDRPWMRQAEAKL